MAHTPGPWFVGYSPEYDIDTGDDGQTIGHLTGKDEFDGTVFSVRMLENGEEELVYIAENIRKEETANLIAAAPEMYQALTLACAAVADVTHCGGDDCTDCEVGTALRKARGEA